MEYGPSLGGTPYVGQPIGLPINFGMRFSTEETVVKDKVSLTEAEKEEMIRISIFEHDERTAEG